jgi:hypothetical protein
VLYALLIMGLRTFDVTLGTMLMIYVVEGRRLIASLILSASSATRPGLR